MNVTISKTDRHVRTALVDILLIELMCLVPTISHALSFPLFKLNPILLCMLTGMAFVRDRRNAILIAVLLPVVPMLITGMPSAIKAICMVGELLTLAFICPLTEKKMPVFLSAITAVLAGKIVYYLLKAILISPAILIGTEWWIQIVTVCVWAGVYSFIKRRTL